MKILPSEKDISFAGWSSLVVEPDADVDGVNNGTEPLEKQRNIIITRTLLGNTLPPFFKFFINIKQIQEF